MPECPNHLFYKMTYKWIPSPSLSPPNYKTIFLSHLLHRHTLWQSSTTAQVGTIAERKGPSNNPLLQHRNCVDWTAAVRRKQPRQPRGYLTGWGLHTPPATSGRVLTPSHTGRPCLLGPGSGGRTPPIEPWCSSKRWRICGRSVTGTSGRPGPPTTPPWTRSPSRAQRNPRAGPSPSSGGWKSSFGVATTGTVIWGWTRSPTTASWRLGRDAGRGWCRRGTSRFWGTWGTFGTPQNAAAVTNAVKYNTALKAWAWCEEEGGRGFHGVKCQSYSATHTIQNPGMQRCITV